MSFVPAKLNENVRFEEGHFFYYDGRWYRQGMETDFCRDPETFEFTETTVSAALASGRLIIQKNTGMPYLSKGDASA